MNIAIPYMLAELFRNIGNAVYIFKMGTCPCDLQVKLTNFDHTAYLILLNDRTVFMWNMQN